MVISLELVERYGTTFIDFWRLRPRKFLPALERDPNRYLSPMQFLAISLGIAFSLGVVAITLSLTVLESASGQEQIGDPKALSARLVVFTFAMLVVGALSYRVISFLWPVRGRALFRQIFEFQCYYMAVILPMSAIDVLVGPAVVELVAREIVPVWVGGLPFLFGYGFGTVAAIFYSVPGIAYLNGVSSVRLLMGTLLWSFIGGFFFGVLFSLLTG